MGSTPDINRSTPLGALLAEYDAAVSPVAAQNEPAHMLTALLLRDRIARLLPDAADQRAILDVTIADSKLKDAAAQIPAEQWRSWRQTITPPVERWWWYLDREQTLSLQRRDLPWVVMAGLFMAATAGVAIEIVRRLWSSGLDSFTVIGAGAALALAGVPISKHSREAAGWLLGKFLPDSAHRGPKLVGAALISFVLVLLLALAGLPVLGAILNNWGATLLNRGDLAGASRAFSHAATLNPAYATAYYNLAQRYTLIGDYDQAVVLHTKALQVDDGLILAYSGLGHALILQGKPVKAIAILRTGLSLAGDGENGTCANVDTELCAALWADLGWAYLDAKRYREAEDALQQALALNPTDAPALCNLALTAEALAHPRQQIIYYWQSCLVNVQSMSIASRRAEVAALARAHLRQLEEQP
ncbi:MAG: tetratricopeptide repeat protein [Caldilineaceae bacterium]|nr:tetratricopeptide repeat protein [Caldilineaceae bacterium]